ncbi:MAG: FadR family transcriptional regulator [Firmicutes bacterium]|nr:FadR family transcriptional regulator [Bacillota bacterium]
MINKKRISDQIFDYILENIKNGELKPGDKLQNERELAEALDVSRVPVREAISSLCQIGILTTKHGYGTFVNEYDPEQVGHTLYMYSLLDKTPILELIEVRKIMESEGARLASQNATEEELEVIKDFMIRREQQIIENKGPEDMALLYKLDNGFHRAIALATHNTMFVKFLDGIRASVRIHQAEAAKQLGFRQKVTSYHKEIYRAIAARDGEKASKAMYEHIEEVENIIKEHIYHDA